MQNIFIVIAMKHGCRTKHLLPQGSPLSIARVDRVIQNSYPLHIATSSTHLPVSVSAVLPTIVPESDENDVVSRFKGTPLYGSASRNLRVFRETKELPSPGRRGCGFRCCREL